MKNNSIFNYARIIGFIIGFLTLVWQVVQIVNGNALNMFLIADIILGLALVITALIPVSKSGAIYLLNAYAFTLGVYSVATFGGLLTDTYDFGAFTTTIGIIPSSIFLLLLTRQLKKAYKRSNDVS